MLRLDLDSMSDPVYPPVSPEPLVVFAKEQPARSEVQAVAGASATLSCEVAQAQTEVTWYKDGKKLSSSSKVRVEAKGCTRKLVVQQAGKADAGEYSCEAGGQKVSFHLDVAGQLFERSFGDAVTDLQPWQDLFIAFKLFVSPIFPPPILMLMADPRDTGWEWCVCEEEGPLLCTPSGVSVL